jgi:hypothetical protein
LIDEVTKLSIDALTKRLLSTPLEEHIGVEEPMTIQYDLTVVLNPCRQFADSRLNVCHCNRYPDDKYDRDAPNLRLNRFANYSAALVNLSAPHNYGPPLKVMQSA